MTASRRVRTALLRLAAPFRRRHPIVLGGPTVTEASRLQWKLSTIEAAAAAERDPSDEAGA